MAEPGEKELRPQGLSINQTRQRLRKENLTPLRAGIWHPAQVAKLLQEGPRGDRDFASRWALELRAEGASLREIGIPFSREKVGCGIRRRCGGCLWERNQWTSASDWAGGRLGGETAG